MAEFVPPTLASETITMIGSFPLRNTIIASWLTVGLLVVAALVFRAKGYRMAPRGFQNFVEAIVEFLNNFFTTITQDPRQTKKFFPIVATIFIYILTSNWLGIFPGFGTIGIYEEHGAPHEAVAEEQPEVEHPEATAEPTKETNLILVPFLRSSNSDVNMTLAIAIISVVMTQVFGISSLGAFSYAKKFFVNPLRDPIGSFVGLLELISEFAKIISFSFRLFGNIFAGEILLVVMGFLVPFIAPLPFYGLELFVGLVQALVFALLTLVFMKMAVTSHEHHEEAVSSSH